MEQLKGSGLDDALNAEHEAVLSRWVEVVETGSRGRISRAELTTELQEILDALLECLKSGSEAVDSDEYAEVRGLLAGLSQSRARQGFSPAETAGSVFALKDAVLEVIVAAPGAAAPAASWHFPGCSMVSAFSPLRPMPTPEIESSCSRRRRCSSFRRRS